MSRKKDTLTETRLAGMIIKGWKGWVDRIEPAGGSTVGFPDLLLFDKSFGILPVELKLGDMKHGVIEPRELRPAQLRWHKSFFMHGGLSAIIVGAEDEDGEITIGIANGKDAEDLNEGINVLKLMKLKQIRSDIQLWVGANRSFR